MLKHKDIIEKLDTLRKAAIVSSAFADAPLEAAGVPAIRRVLLDEAGKRGGVSYESAARSWDPALIGRMTQELALEAGQEEGARLFVSPDLKVPVDPHRPGLSEDGYLNGLIGSAAIRAVHSIGGLAGLSQLSLTEEDTAYLDRREESSAVHDVVMKPFVHATDGVGCDVVFSDPTRLGKGYYHTNRALFAGALGGAYGDAFVVGDGGPASADAIKLLNGKVALGGIEIPLQRALRRYAQLAVYEKEGSVAHHDLEESLRDGSAVDMETLDAAVDAIIDFAIRLDEGELHMPPVPPMQPAPAPVVPAQPAETSAEQIAEAPSEAAAPEAEEAEGGEQPAEEQAQTAEEAPASEEPAPAAIETPAPETPAPAETAQAPAPEAAAPVFTEASLGNWARRRAAESCIVLLKNESVLPLAMGTKIAVLGESYRDLTAFGERFRIVGKAAGYALEEERSDEMIPLAIRATNKADVVLVFLYPDPEGRGLALPANRLALIDALQRAKKRVIALVCGDRPVDLSFDRSAAATLVVPADGPYASEALARVLTGEVNPSGRLTRTAYDDADDYFRAYRADRDAGRMHIGSLVGYRRSVTGEERVRYPFGAGIGYSPFAYTDLKIDKDFVTFTLTNTGYYDGSEVVQIYMGAPGGTHIVPKRQLISFRKVFLHAGESKKVTFCLPADRFATFDHRLYAENVESGEYRLYIGSSVSDIRLFGKRYLRGVEREPLPERMADYFPNGDYVTVERVGQEHRVKEREQATQSETLRRIRKGVLYAMPVVGLLGFILFTILILSYALDYALLSAVGQETMEWILYIASIAVLGVIPLLGALNRKRVARMRTIALYAFPVLFFACFLLGAVLMSPNGGIGEEIALRVLSCFTIGVPILAVVATFVERDLWHTHGGQDHWDKFYFERKRDAQITSDEEFEEAFRRAEEARAAREAARAAAAEEEKPEEAPAVPQFYDKRLTYEQFLRDCKTYITERGLTAGDGTLATYLGALSATQLIVVPAGLGATLAETIAGYFGKKAYIDNAEKYRRYDDLFSQWRQHGRANQPTNLSLAISTAKYETAYLHTVLIRHIGRPFLTPLFRPVTDVLAHRRTALPLEDGTNTILPPNLVIVAELEDERVGDLPACISEVAAILSPACEECEPAEHKTVVPVVGYERFTAMRSSVRDDYPLPESCWKNVDLLQGLCKTANLGNRLWLKLEYHASVAAACGEAPENALDGALATEALPWLSSVWNEELCGKSLRDALSDVFGESNIEQGLAAIAGEEEQ